MRKKAVFAYSFSDKNAGDFSLNISAIKILVDNGYFVTVVSRFCEGEEQFISTRKYLVGLFAGSVQLVGSPFRLDRSASLYKSVFNNLHGLLVSFGLIRNSEVDRLICNSDLVVLCGGNVLRCGRLSDYMRLRALDYPLSIARKFGKRYIIFPQSTAGINFFGKRILGRMINNADVVFVREDISFDRLSSWYPSARLEKSLDLAFFLMNEDLFKDGRQGRKKIAFTIRAEAIGGLGALSHGDEAAVVEQVKAATLSLASNHDVYYIIQGSESDREITYKIRNELLGSHGLDVPVLEEHDTFRLIEIYSGFDLLVGMRLHSIILAAIAGTPSYGLFLKEWGFKNPGILAQLDLPCSFVDDGGGVDVDRVEELLAEKKKFQGKVSALVDRNSDAITRFLS